MTAWAIAAIAVLALAACASGPRPVAEDGRAIERVEFLLIDSGRVSLDSLRRAGVMLERVVDQRPALITMGDLHYPDDLRQMGIQGRVVLRFILDRDGRPETNTINVVSADDPGFIYPARVALMSARFRPAKVHGQPVRVVINVPFDFKIRRTMRGARP
jgi:TonB family protein